MPGFLVINPRSGKGRPDARELANAARELGIQTHVLAPGEDPGEVARSGPAEALGMAGGDGSLGAVATVAIERGLAFVCVPFGTRNHFARDIGLDRADPLGALAAFQGMERRVDVGRANGRLFLNNVSLGAYASLVHRREHHRRRGEALARIRALKRSLRPSQERLTVDGEPIDARVVLVANNSYALDLFSLGARARLDEGHLHLYAAGGVLPTSWEERAGDTFEIGGPHRLKAAFDGEPAVVETPLRCSIEPGALTLLLPPG